MITETEIGPKIGDVRYVITWIDAVVMRKSDGKDEDLGDRLEAAERAKLFPTEAAAKAWAQANADRDEYGNPRFEKRVFQREYHDVPAEWMRSDADYQEWDGAWQPLVF